MRARFERIFKRRTGFATLDRLLARLHAKKPQLLLVLDHPQIPLHTNGSENDIRCQVTRRKISGGTRSDIGRDCRDAFLSLAKTCAKLGIAFWDYLGDRLAIPAHPQVPSSLASSRFAANPPDRPAFCHSYECKTFDLYFRECFEQIAAFAAGRKLRLANPEVEGRAR